MAYGANLPDLFRERPTMSTRFRKAEASRPPGRAANQVRSGDRCYHRQGARALTARRRCSPAPTR